MAWIELHQSLPSNKKTLRLKSLLRLKTSQAVGHMCLLWLWALDNAPEGDLSQLSCQELAEVCDWNKNRAKELREALIQVGFLDLEGDRLRIHDWGEYAGRLIESRNKAAERKRRSRQRQKERPVTVTAGDAAALPYPTVPNPTQPYPTEPNPTVPDKAELCPEENNSAGAVADESSGPRQPGQDFLDYLRQRDLLSGEFLGAGREVIAGADELCRSIFRRFCSREPTELDRVKTLRAVSESRVLDDGSTVLSLDEDRCQLLCYAFEAAARAGAGGNWQYIQGVLSRLGARGIVNLAQAEIFDLERDGL